MGKSYLINEPFRPKVVLFLKLFPNFQTEFMLSSTKFHWLRRLEIIRNILDSINSEITKAVIEGPLILFWRFFRNFLEMAYKSCEL